jgi:hypothetical protein
MNPNSSRRILGLSRSERQSKMKAKPLESPTGRGGFQARRLGLPEGQRVCQKASPNAGHLLNTIGYGGAKPLKSLALPSGIEPLSPP